MFKNFIFIKPIRKFFPKNYKRWKMYFSIFFPITISSVIYAFNGFVDNFMVASFNGMTGISAANQWTSIVLGIGFGTTALGSVLSARFYYAGQYKEFREVAKIRFIFSFLIALVFAIVAWTPLSKDLLKVFLQENKKVSIGLDKDYQKFLEDGDEYLKIIAIQWLLISITANLTDQLSEIGHARAPFYWSILTLASNVIMNLFFMEWLEPLFGVENLKAAGAAWASVISRIVAFVFAIIYIWTKKLELRFSPWSLFMISRSTLKIFLKKFNLFLAGSILIVLVTMRSAIYAWAFPVGELEGGGGAPFVLAIANTVFQVVSVGLTATSVMAVNFVGYQLAKKNIEKAKRNSKELIGFNLTFGLFTSLLLVILGLNMTNLESILINQEELQGIEAKPSLLQAAQALYVLAFFYPFFTLASTLYRNGVQGGKTKWFAYGDMFLNTFQIGWAALTMGVIAYSIGGYWVNNIWPSYALFFSSSILKTIWQLVCYNVIDWAQKIEDPIILKITTNIEESN